MKKRKKNKKPVERDKLIQKSFNREISLKEIIIPNRKRYSRKDKSWKRNCKSFCRS